MYRNEPKIILIGIQARSTSTRLPGKSSMEIGGKPIVAHVIHAAKKACHYMTRQFGEYQAIVKVWLLVPKGDELAEKYRSMGTMVYEGSEEDCLSRYVDVAKMEKADYILRLTGDCLSIPSFIISGAIKSTIKYKNHMTTNCIYRTHPEGWDVEIVSKELLDWLDIHSEGEDREHVTSLCKKDLSKFPFKYRGKPSITHIMENYDLSAIKTSIDTQEEFDRALRREEKLMQKIKDAELNGFALIPKK